MSGRVGPLKPSFINTYSLDFDGVDDYVSTSAKIIGSDITLSAWVNFNGGSYTSFIAQFPLSITPSNSAAPNETIGRFYKRGTLMEIAIQCYDQTGGNFSTYSVRSFDFEGAGWQHVCWTYNVTTKHIYVYLNGVAQTWTNFGGTITTPYLTAVGIRLYESDLTIGRVRPATSTGTFLGLVDEVATWDRILTQEEITSIASAPTDLTDRSPIAWYRMGDNGLYKDPQWLIPSNENKDKVSNYSFEFDGVDDDFTCSDLSSLVDNKSKLSISFWVNLPDVTEINRITGKCSNPASTSKWLSVNGNITNGLNFVVSNGGLAYVEANNVLTNNTWHHIVCVFNGTQAVNVDRAKIYVDSVDETQSIIGTLPSTTYDFTLEPTNPTWYLGQVGLQLGINELRGKLNEYAIYSDVALTDLEVNEIYNGGVPNDLSSLSVTPDLWYKMGEEATFSGGVWTVPDAIGSNDGTSNAMTIEDRVGTAPSSSNNALSFNMDLIDRVPNTP